MSELEEVVRPQLEESSSDVEEMPRLTLSSIPEAAFLNFKDSTDRQVDLHKRVNQVPPLLAQVTSELKRYDEDRFNSLTIQIEEILLDVESDISFFTSKVKQEFIRVPLTSYFWVWCMSFFSSRVSDILDTFRSRKEKRRALLEYGDDTLDLIEEYRSTMDHVIYEDVYALQTKYLDSDDKYKKLLRDLDDKIVRKRKTQYSGNNWRPLQIETEQLINIKARMEKSAFNRAFRKLNKIK